MIEIIFYLIASFIALRIVLGEFNVILSIRFTLIFMSMNHILGIITNIVSLLKKEKKVETTKEKNE